jgi:hypothetical protein
MAVKRSRFASVLPNGFLFQYLRFYCLLADIRTSCSFSIPPRLAKHPHNHLDDDNENLLQKATTEDKNENTKERLNDKNNDARIKIQKF